MIREITRGHIILETEDGVVQILGEAFLPGHGSPDFVVYENSINEWSEPEKKDITPDEKKLIIDQLMKDAKGRKINIEIE